MVVYRAFFGTAFVFAAFTLAHAELPDPTKKIVIGAYWVPYPNSNAAYSYDSIKAVGVDVVIALANHPDPGGDPTNLVAQTAMINAAADAGLLALIQRRDGSYPNYTGVCEDLSPSQAEVQSVMNAAVFNNSAVYGWNTWDEPTFGNHLGETAKLDSFVRIANQTFLGGGYNCSGNSQWITFLGWLYPGDDGSFETLLDHLDENDGTGSGRRPVFGVSGYRFRQQFDDYYPDTTCGQVWAFPIGALNWRMCQVFEAARAPGRTYATDPNQYPYWAITRVTDERCFSARTDGPPSEASIRMDVFTRLAWGAKGIFYYTYLHGQPETDWGDSADPFHWLGVYASNPQNYQQVRSSDYFNDVYYWIRNINEDIAELKPYLGPAECKRPVLGRPHHYYPYWTTWADSMICASSFVDSLCVSPIDSNVCAIATPMVNPDNSDRYLLVVNQRERDYYQNFADGPISISVKINPDSLPGSGSYLIAKDILNDRWLLSGDFLLSDVLDSGQAKMYIITKWDGGNLTIPTGTTVKCLTSVSTSGTVSVGSGVIWEMMEHDLVVAGGGRLELGSNVTISFDLDHCKDLHVNAGGTLIGSGSTSVIEGPINVSGNSATVENVKVLFGDPYGTGQSIISVSGCDTTTIIKDCILSGSPNENDHYGIGCSNASPRIRGVAIDTVYAGIYAYNGSDPVIYRPAVYDDPDCEGTVTNNLGASCYCGVQAYLNSEYQGGYYNPPNTRFGGNNFRRANSATGAHVYASNTGQQKLDYNYWNGGPDVLVYNGAYATTYPQCGSPFPRPGRSGGDERQPVFAAIDSAVAVLADHDTTGALDNLRALAGRQTEAMDALFVLDRITELCSPERVVSLTEGLRTPESRPAARQAAMWVMGRARHAQGELLGAAQWYAQVRELDADSLLATESKFAEAELLFDLAGKRDRALVLFREFLAEASADNPNRLIAQGRLRMADQVGDKMEPGVTRPASLPLLAAHPNPFNPTTSITYRVTAQGDVSVQVYNALGQRVRELVNTTAQPGTYTVVWDGKDSATRPVGSGVYLIRLTTPTAVVTERVTLAR